jgi:hypothetical protein
LWVPWSESTASSRAPGPGFTLYTNISWTTLKKKGFHDPPASNSPKLVERLSEKSFGRVWSVGLVVQRGKGGTSLWLILSARRP